ncbi:hypothetical protein EDD18DRAFT_202167 [Armillaria luteobubalina]|uniref:Uncharacterized protein n=1 Tax=Armillaria luteobubalina TaxID=153913 RepID=A0AA39Q4W0_9AGAR|nr:hypothetical protein EDD18DRAFT_202167 [Armillaria luteobubalina]
MFGCCAPLRFSSLSGRCLVLPLRWLSRIHSTRTRNRVSHTRTATTWGRNTESFFRRLFCCYVERQNMDTAATTAISEQTTMISNINEDNSGYSNSAYSEGAYSGNVSAMTTVTEETIIPQPAPERYTGPKPITHNFDMLSTITMPLPQIVVTLPTRARSSFDDITRFSLPLEAYIVPLSPPPRRRRRWLESPSSSQASSDIQDV